MRIGQSHSWLPLGLTPDESAVSPIMSARSTSPGRAYSYGSDEESEQRVPLKHQHHLPPQQQQQQQGGLHHHMLHHHHPHPQQDRVVYDPPWEHINFDQQMRSAQHNQQQNQQQQQRLGSSGGPTTTSESDEDNNRHMQRYSQADSLTTFGFVVAMVPITTKASCAIQGHDHLKPAVPVCLFSRRDLLSTAHDRFRRAEGESILEHQLIAAVDLAMRLRDCCRRALWRRLGDTRRPTGQTETSDILALKTLPFIRTRILVHPRGLCDNAWKHGERCFGNPSVLCPICLILIARAPRTLPMPPPTFPPPPPPPLEDIPQRSPAAVTRQRLGAAYSMGLGSRPAAQHKHVSWIHQIVSEPGCWFHKLQILAWSIRASAGQSL
ncbi:hypothetical protein EGW08_009986 [Elysia chlorotica]|uniref:Uncharacterized protein n=1 Tax=Elysia chlorotica TaxID=188477 RepID=A0A433TL09_ELYCH|nr:hypothetical protein EGW08_009986 [Elysia chlorotica]